MPPGATSGCGPSRSRATASACAACSSTVARCSSTACWIRGGGPTGSTRRRRTRRPAPTSRPRADSASTSRASTVKVEPARWYYHADRLGLLVWQDMPSGENRTPDARDAFGAELRRVADAPALHARLYGPPPVVQGVLLTSRAEGQAWRYTTETPADGWTRLDFNDSRWHDGPGGFGRAPDPGPRVRTSWTSSDLWLRRAFTLPRGDLASPHLLVRHDEDAEVYLNGTRIATREGVQPDVCLPRPGCTGAGVAAARRQPARGPCPEYPRGAVFRCRDRRGDRVTRLAPA